MIKKQRATIFLAGNFLGMTAFSGLVGAQDEAVTFNQEIAPLLLRHCAACHREGGRAPFSLTSYEAAKKHAADIAKVVESGQMPPWLPDRELVAFRHERGLEEAEVKKIAGWVEKGMPEGDGEFQFPELPKGWQLGEPDLVVDLLEPIEISGESSEFFRNFVIPGLPADAKEPRTVRAVDFEFEPAGLVLRATISQDTAGIGRRLDAIDLEPGYPGIIGGAIPGSPIISWSPGQAPEEFRGGRAIVLEPGADLVLQLHLDAGEKPLEQRARVGFYFGDDPPKSEIETVHLGASGFTIPAGSKGFRIRDRVNLGTPVQVLSLLPHAHRLATRFAAWAELPNGDKQPLILIPQWDYRWRQTYHFAEPVSLPAGAVIYMEAFYDNVTTEGSGQTVRNVAWGPLTSDERADLWLTVAPATPADQKSLTGAVYLNDLRRQLFGYQAILKSDPGNFEANSQIGHVLVNQEKPDQAVPFLNAALKARPDDWLSWHNRGMARFFLKDLRGAKLNFRKAVELNEEYAPAHNGLAAALSLSKEFEESIPHYRKYLELRPHDIEIGKNFAVVLGKLGKLEEAEAEYRRILEQAPEEATMLSGYGRLLARQGKIEEGLAKLNEAEKLAPGNLRIRVQKIETLMEVKRFDEAQKAAETILELDPANEAALNLIDFIESASKEAAESESKSVDPEKP